MATIETALGNDILPEHQQLAETAIILAGYDLRTELTYPILAKIENSLRETNAPAACVKNVTARLQQTLAYAQSL